MSRVKIDADEWYPVYSIRDYGHEVEVSDEQLARWERAAELFTAAQDEMGVIYRAAEKVERERQQREKAEREAAEKVRREAEREAARARSERQSAAMRRLVGTVYDADGNPVGEVERGSGGLSVRPIVEPERCSPRGFSPTTSASSTPEPTSAPAPTNPTGANPSPPAHCATARTKSPSAPAATPTQCRSNPSSPGRPSPGCAPTATPNSASNVQLDT